MPSDTLARRTPEPGDPAPPLVLKDLDGKEHSLADYRGRTVVVNFWATWCAPCVEEMPSLQLLRESHAARGFEVLAVNAQENAARIRPFLERYAIDLVVLRDHDGSVRAAWNVHVFPTSFVIGPDQRIAFVVMGETDWNAAPMRSRIQALLAR